jgi:hypothetical protein
MTREDVQPNAQDDEFRDGWGGLSWCDNVWCGQVYDTVEGWAGRCPSCLALADEHLAGFHVVVIEVCAECRRGAPRGQAGASSRSA